MANIEVLKGPDGRKKSGKPYRASITLNGERHRKTFSTRRAAEQWQRKTLAELENRLYGVQDLTSKRTVGDVVLRYLGDRIATQNESGHWEPVLQDNGDPYKKGWKDMKNRLLRWNADFGQVSLYSLGPTLIQEQLGNWEVTGQTWNNYVSVLRAALKHVAGAGMEWLTHNPAALVERRKPGQRDRVMTTDEWQALLTAAEELATDATDRYPRARLLPTYLRLLYVSVCRRGEALGLRVSDIHAGTMSCTFRDPKNGKTRRGDLSAAPNLAQQLIDLPRPEGSPWVFAGSMIDDATTLDEPFRRARTLAGIGIDDNGEALVQHSIRHTGCTEIAMGEASLVDLMELSGHRSIAAVKKYIHSDASAQRRAQKARALKI